MSITTDNPASERPKPPPIEPRCPPCSICGEDTSYDDGTFVCNPCGAAWGEDDYHYQAGEWTEEGGQCPSALAYWRDSVEYPRLRATDSNPLAAAVAGLLDEELQDEHGIDNCPGRQCPEFNCPTELDEGFVDELGHHHCRWCIALSLSWEHPEPTAVRLARAVLEGGV